MVHAPIETTNYRGYTIELFPDHDAENPREWDNVGTLALGYKDNPDLGDEYIKDPIMWLADMVDEEDRMDRLFELGATGEDVFRYLEKRFFEEYTALPVFKYEHGGVAFNTSGFGCPWDSGMIGYIYADKKTVQKEFEGDEQRAKEHLRTEVEIFSNWANGNFVGFVTYDDQGEEFDSCWGFESEQHAIDAAKEEIEG